MAGANEDDQIKCLVIKNQSNADITLYIYLGWAPFCMISTISKIIKPDQRYLYHEETPFKFEIVAKSLDDEKAKNLLGPVEWKEDKVITITESLECQQENLTKIENGRQLCLREIHREEELVPGNLYDTLGLDMEEVRKMNNEDAEKVIKKAYKKQMQTWHPDKNFGNHEITIQIILAKEILVDHEIRARYHNEIDYNKGWLSRKRWKAIFWPDCYTEEQKKAFRNRIYLSLGSFGSAVGGIALSFGTAGAAAPAVVILGAIFGGGFTGAGFQSLGHTVCKKSVVDGCDVKSWCLKAGIGFVGGAVTGGAALGITAGMVGIGSAAIGSGAVTVGQYVGMGAATGAVGGVASSLSSDFAKKYVDKEEVTLGQFASRAARRGMIGAGAGALGGLATKGTVDNRASAATAALRGSTVVEQVYTLTRGRRIARAVSKQVTITGAKAVLGMPSKIYGERLDDAVENQNIMKHIQSGLKDIPVNTLQSDALYKDGRFIGHGIEEATLDEQSSSRNAATSKEAKAENYLNNNEANGNNQGPGNEMFSKLSFFTEEKGMNKQNETDKSGNQSSNANVNKSGNGRSDTTGERGAPEPEDQSYEKRCSSTQQNPHVGSEESRANHESSNGESCKENREPSDDKNKKQEDDEPPDVMIKYISTGARFSKMIVTWYLNGEEKKEEVSGDGKRVYISADATDIEVRFQVQRPLWGDIMKYDRFKKTWCEPFTPHIFRYKKAVDRTFTLSGPLGWEAVTRISDEHHEETYEMS
jgi:hypothetical protein